MKNTTCVSHETWLTSSAVPTSLWAANSSSRWAFIIPQDLTLPCSLCVKSTRGRCCRGETVFYISPRLLICRCLSETAGRGLKKSPGCWMGMNLLLQVRSPGCVNVKLFLMGCWVQWMFTCTKPGYFWLHALVWFLTWTWFLWIREDERNLISSDRFPFRWSRKSITVFLIGFFYGETLSQQIGGMKGKILTYSK